MSLEPRTYTVFVVDDNDDARIWERRFDDDRVARSAVAAAARAELRGRVDQASRSADEVPSALRTQLDAAEAEYARQDERRFALLGGVYGSAPSVRAHLRQTLIDGFLPDLVIFDQQLSSADDPDGFSADGLPLMSWFRGACVALGRDLPPSVLWTSKYDDGIAHAFVDRGGRHAFPRDLPGARFISALWRVLDEPEFRWRPPTSPTGVQLPLTKGVLPVLPYFEAGLSTHEIVSRMQEAGDLPRVKDGPTWVNDKRSTIMQLANTFAEDHALADRFHKGQTEALARFARAHGHSWVPLRYREA